MKPWLTHSRRRWLRLLLVLAMLLCWLGGRWHPAALRYDANTELNQVHADFLILVNPQPVGGAPVALRLRDWLAQAADQRSPLFLGPTPANASGLPVRVSQQGSHVQLHQMSSTGSRAITLGVSVYRIEAGQLRADYFLPGTRAYLLFFCLAAAMLLLSVLRVDKDEFIQNRPDITPKQP